jgi:hypothetical protein
LFKTKEEVIVIQAEATDPITTGVVFWSHDKGTAKLLFQLKKGTVSQTLAKGTIVPICLVFNGGRHIYHAVIEDAVNGIVSIVLEDNILGYVGRVEGSIYIELPDSRSLDTAGRFTFDIKRSPIDENVPELKDYYWQGFNEIMAQYHQTIATIKLEAKALLDSLTADVTTAQSKITQLEQSITTANTNLNARIDEINKKIDDNDVFTKAESSANVIDQVSGKEKTTINFVMDFKNKTAGSDVENPHRWSAQSFGTLLSPTSAWLPNGQNRIDQIKNLDGVVTGTSTSTNGRMEQNLAAWNIFEIVKRRLGDEYFTSQGAITTASKVAILRKIITKANYKTYGFGLGASGNKISSTVFGNVEKSYSLETSHSNSTITEIGADIPTDQLDTFISEEGVIFINTYAGATDGVIPSKISVDYVSVEFTIEVSANEIIKSEIAANHRENLATQEEAELGEDNTKTMTPLRTAQQIDEKAVSIVGNQTVLGTKDFQDGILVAGKKPVLTKATTDYAITDSTVNPAMFGGGYIKLYRRGDLVYLTASFKLAVEKFNQGVWFNPPDWARPIDNARFNLKREDNTNALFIFNSPGNGDNTIICSDNIAANTWLNGSASWMARDPY